MKKKYGYDLWKLTSGHSMLQLTEQKLEFKQQHEKRQLYPSIYFLNCS